MTAFTFLIFMFGFLAGATIQFVLMSDMCANWRIVLKLEDWVYWVQRMWHKLRYYRPRYFVGHPAYSGQANYPSTHFTLAGVVVSLLRRGVALREALAAAHTLTTERHFRSWMVVRTKRSYVVELTRFR